MSRDALVVGINKYPFLKDLAGNYKHLTTPASDAEAIAQILEAQNNFRVKRFPATIINGKLQVDPNPHKPFKTEELEKVILDLFLPETGKSPETALLFFAGHGLRKPLGKSTKGFLATSDVSPRKNQWGFPLADLWDILQQSEVKQQIIWLDCCFSGELLNFGDTELGRQSSGGCDRSLIAASRDYELAYEQLDGKHGVLTSALLAGLDRHQTQENEWVTNEKLAVVVREKLQAYYQQTKICQTPLISNHGEAIKLIRGKGKPPSEEEKIDIASNANSGQIMSIQGNHRQLKLQLTATNALLDKVTSELSEEKLNELEEIRELERKGYVKSAYNRAQDLKESKNWDVFTEILQAKVLRMLAGYAITIDQDTVKATALADEAHSLDPNYDDTFIRSVIYYQSNGAEAALTNITTINDISVYNLKLGLLLELGRFDDVIIAIQTIPEAVEANAETYRLHALTLLSQGSIKESRSKIQEATNINPDWDSIREAKAIIDYFSSLSPAALPRYTFPQPEPVEYTFVKRDAESLQRLREAESLFANLIEDSEESDERYKFRQEWLLACLGNDLEKKSEAEAFCRTLLKEDFAHARAIIWAISRNYQVDLSISQEALETTVSKLDASVEQVTVLLWLYVNQEDYQNALELLENKKELFERENLVNYWEFWHLKTLIFIGKQPEELQEANILSNTDLGRILHIVVLRENARKENNWQLLIEYLEKCFQETEDAKFLYELCQLKADLKEWNYVADKAELLIKALGTFGAVDLAACCCWNAGRITKCLQLLHDNHELVPNGILPSHLRHIRIWCLIKTGFKTQALAEAESLSREYENIEYLWTWMNLQYHQGDTKGLVVTARNLVSREDVQPINLLIAARWVHLEDKALACRLWSKATEKPIQEEILGSAIDIGFRLSLETELRPFIQRAQRLAFEGKGPFKAVEFREILALRQTTFEHLTELYQQYERGELPIHLIAEVSKMPLVNFFQATLQKNTATLNPQFQPPVFTRYGGRSAQLLPFSAEFITSCSQWCLYLDISAFLLAAHLDILDTIEQYFKPLKISAALLPALVSQRERLHSHQPSVLKTHRQILYSITAGKLKEVSSQNITKEFTEIAKYKGRKWAYFLEQAKVKSGYVVDFLPLKKVDFENNLQLVDLPESLVEYVINCRGLVEALKQNNLLTDEQYQEALTDLGDEGSPASLSPIPQLNSPIFFISSTIDVLIKTKIFNKICQHFQIYIEHSYAEELRVSLEENEKKSSELNQYLTALIERVRHGLKEGIYKEITRLNDNTNSELQQEREDNWDFLTTVDLLTFEAQPNDIVWIDDRCCNQYPNREGALIITILEVLDALLAVNQLSQDEYYDKILQLRKANVRYIPITSQEIIYFLKQAQVIDGLVKETEELSVIRRYLASCLLDSHRLCLPPVTPDISPYSQGEYAFVWTSFRATEDAIIAAWLDEKLTEEYARAYADWILADLYTGIFGIQHLTAAETVDNHDINFVAIDINSFYLTGIKFSHLDFQQQEDNLTKRQSYFDWIEKAIVNKRFVANPETIEIVAQTIHTVIVENQRQYQNDDSQNLINKIFLKNLYKDLPDNIRIAIQSDINLMNSLGIKSYQTINIGSIIFPVPNLWQAIKTALTGETVIIAALQPKLNFNIQALYANDSLKITVEIKSEDNQICKTIDDPLLLILSDDKSLQLKVLEHNRFWFDCDDGQFKELIDKIISIESYIERFETTKKKLENSSAKFYADLEQTLQFSEHLKLDELIPPSSDGLVQYFRLNQTVNLSGNFSQTISNTAESLLKSEGLEETLNRLVCLPVRLPNCVFEALARLTKVERCNLLCQNAIPWASPVSKIHLIDLTIYFGNDGKKVIGLCQTALDELLSENGEVHFRLFLAILKFVNNKFSYWVETREWNTPIKLSMLWAHTSRLQNILDVPNLKIDNFVQTFEQCNLGRQIDADTLNNDPEFWNDILCPHHQNRMEFIVNSLVKITQEKPAEVLEKIGIVSRVETYLSRIEEGQSVPDNSRLLHDPMLTEDSLGAFLRCDRAQSPLLGTELSQYLASDKLKAIVEEAVQILEDNPLTEYAWLRLIAIVKDLPIYDDLKQGLKNILENLDILSLLEAKPSLAILAFEVASSQIKYFEDEQLRLQLQNKVIYLAQLLANREKETNLDEKLIYRFIEIVFKLSAKSNNPRETSTALGILLKQVLSQWQSLAKTYLDPIMLRFVTELPIQQLHGLWEVILYLRAIREKEQ
jgi:hypothetical protein